MLKTFIGFYPFFSPLQTPEGTEDILQLIQILLTIFCMSVDNNSLCKARDVDKASRLEAKAIDDMAMARKIGLKAKA